MARRARPEAVLDQEDSTEPASRRRIPRPRPYEIGSLLPWTLRATCGDPILLLVPLVEVVALTLLVLAVGAPGEPEILLPLVSLPPVDAFQDVGMVDLVAGSEVWTWVLRGLFLVVRVYAFGALAALAIERARGGAPAVRTALARVRERRSTLLFLELVSFGAFGSVLVLRSSLPEARADDSVGAALVFGVLFLPTAFLAAVADGLPAGRALRRSFLWMRRRPLGHLVVSIGYVAALNGLYRLTVAGAIGRPTPVATALFAFAVAFVAMLFLTGLARRYDLLYSEGSVAEWTAARRATGKEKAPAETRARGKRAGRKDRRRPKASGEKPSGKGAQSPKGRRERKPKGKPGRAQEAPTEEAPDDPTARPDRPGWMG